MIARCFQQVHYPILPIVQNEQQDQLRFYERDFRLFTPSDFDYSPYFEIIKYPAWNAGREPAYRTLPWHQEEEHPHELVNKIPPPVHQPPGHAPDETTITADFADRTGRVGQWQRLVGFRTFFRQA
jgi:hypothetical protein